jgi:hypothetical protein
LPRREQVDDAGRRIYDSLANPKGGTIEGLRGPGGILLHSPELAVSTIPSRVLWTGAMSANMRICIWNG